MNRYFIHLAKILLDYLLFLSFNLNILFIIIKHIYFKFIMLKLYLLLYQKYLKEFIHYILNKLLKFIISKFLMDRIKVHLIIIPIKIIKYINQYQITYLTLHFL